MECAEHHTESCAECQPASKDQRHDPAGRSRSVRVACATAQLSRRNAGGPVPAGGARMELTVKITPRVAAGVARRLRLAASVRSRSMSAVVNDVLDEALPSLEEIRAQLDCYLPAAASGSTTPGVVAGSPAGARGRGRR
jgi:hypothetical protein